MSNNEPFPHPSTWFYSDGCIKANDAALPVDYDNCEKHYQCRQLICETISKKRALFIIDCMLALSGFGGPKVVDRLMRKHS